MFGPYSPSSRLFLNPLYADPALVFGAAPSPRGARTIGEDVHDGAALIDWPAGGACQVCAAAGAVRDFVDK